MFRAVHKPQDAPITQYFLVCKNRALKLALEQNSSDEVSLLPPGAPACLASPELCSAAGTQLDHSSCLPLKNLKTIGKIKAQKA